MKNNQRSHWESCFLGLLLLFTASEGMPLSEDHNDWQRGKDASEKIIRKLWELEIDTNIPVSRNITCHLHGTAQSRVSNRIMCHRNIILLYHVIYYSKLHEVQLLTRAEWLIQVSA